jgi:small-conductance mechanosensitive channel
MWMKASQWVVTSVLLLLVIGTAVALIMTRDSGAPVDVTRGRRPPLVDEQPIKTARTLVSAASDRDELRVAQQVLKLADHEVDVAFSSAMRDASENPTPPTAATKKLYARLSQTQAALAADQARIELYQKELAAAKADQKDTLQQQVDLLKAQLELDQDELEDAQGDLMRSGVDKLGRVQRQFNRHESAQHDFEASQKQANAYSEYSGPASDLAAQFSAWRSLRTKRLQLEQAQGDALHASEVLRRQHDLLEQRVSSDSAGKTTISQQAESQLQSASPEPQSGARASATITSLRRLAADQKGLTEFDKRIQDQEDLANAYGNWRTLVKSRELHATHRMIRSLLLILLVVFGAYLSGRLIDHFFASVRLERTRLHTLQIVLRFTVQSVGVLLILFVIIGMPAQMPTILGLAGAGLTVAMKDFIVAFFGWFVLMGRNGIRVGDWVEINGVVGEVVEINLWHTVLLETGNWTDTGHPTGRKVAFMNSFAIEGHYFNFSTSGQWLWDEVELLVPPSENPYPIIDRVQKMVVKDTEQNAQAAEQEWQKAAGKYRMQSVSAAPAINLRPTGAGIEVHVRYITRASERFATRTRLYQHLVELFHAKGEDVSTAQIAARV